MVGGTLRCLGSVQHLKGRFGAGYRLEMRLAAHDRHGHGHGHGHHHSHIRVNLGCESCDSASSLAPAAPSASGSEAGPTAAALSLLSAPAATAPPAAPPAAGAAQSSALQRNHSPASSVSDVSVGAASSPSRRSSPASLIRLHSPHQHSPHRHHHHRHGEARRERHHPGAPHDVHLRMFCLTDGAVDFIMGACPAAQLLEREPCRLVRACWPDAWLAAGLMHPVLSPGRSRRSVLALPLMCNLQRSPSHQGTLMSARALAAPSHVCWCSITTGHHATSHAPFTLCRMHLHRCSACRGPGWTCLASLSCWRAAGRPLGWWTTA